MNYRALLAFIILAVTAVLGAAILSDWISVGFFVGPYRFSHWMSWFGALFVAVYAPAYHFLKRRYSKRRKTLLDIHVFGFLLAFLLITIHFTGQLSRPPQAFPDLGEGVALVIVVLLLVSTGIVQRFGLFPKGQKRHYTPRFNLYLHTSLLVAFYVVVAVHVLATLGII